jgi:16S rRNA pseudouridine516 synthase
MIGKLSLESLELEEGEWCFLDAEQLSLMAPE